MNSPVSPNRWLLGGSLIALGLIAGAGVVVFYVFSMFASLMRIEAPGSGEIDLEPGTYSLYWESPLLVNKGKKFPGGSIGVFLNDGGPPLTLTTELFWPISYNTIDHSGESIAEFTVDRKGSYRISMSEPNLKQPVPGGLSIGRALTISVLLKVAPIPLGFIAGGVGLGLLVLLKRPKAA
ncbi:MAG TPA: hypothetical protein VKW04_19980 [Planctomycetota bacterium]|nr:hypothetical protein [Planctomycetota bacterium]